MEASFCILANFPIKPISHVKRPPCITSTIQIKRYTNISSPPSKLLDIKKLPELTTVNPPLLNPLQKLAASALDMFKWSLMELEKNHKLPKPVNPAVQLVGNFAPVPECPDQHGLN